MERISLRSRVNLPYPVNIVYHWKVPVIAPVLQELKSITVIICKGGNIAGKIDPLARIAKGFIYVLGIAGI